jgi:hypothetical protein
MDPLTGTAYSIEDYVEMHFLYGKHEGNAKAAADEFSEKHNIQTKSSTVSNLHTRLNDTGCVFPRKREIGMSTRRAHQLDVVEAAAEDEPTISIRRISRETGIARGSVHSALKFAGLRAYHATPVQDLEQGDYEQRSIFSKWIRNHEDVLQNILFTDEAQFNREGVMNSRNYHLWAESNPYATRTRNFQKKLSVNVWAGIIGGLVVGPYFLPPRLNSSYYREFLETNLNDFFDEVPLGTRDNLYFQQDGCPAHSATIVTNFLNERFPGKWLGRYGPIRWPARSPDFTPLDFFLWGEIKRLVYENRPVINSVEELQERITAAFQTVISDVVKEAVYSMARRARLCLSEKGGHFEQLL